MIFKRLFILKLCAYWLALALVTPMNAMAQALPEPQPERVSRAISGALQDGMRSRGFASNDPRFGNTLARMSPKLSVIAGSSAAVVTAGAITAPPSSTPTSVSA